MKKILVYGDSFASSENDGYAAWVDQLGKKLELNVLNRAVSGSSSEYAMKCLIGDVHRGFFEKDDIIIFVSSTPGRLHFEFQNNRPETASQYWNNVDTRDPKHDWYNRSKKHIEWYMVNYDGRMSAINHSCYVHALKNLAAANPECTIVHLSNSHHNYHEPIDLPLGPIPRNFLQPDIFLNTVSSNEYIGSLDYTEFIKYTGYDPRLNHMCNVNLDILSTVIADAIKTHRVDKIKYDIFEKSVFNIITNRTDYISYIGRGLLYQLSGIESQLPKE